MQNQLQGRVWKFGDNINTDLIIAVRYMLLSEAEQLPHTLEAADPNFAKSVKPGDIIVGGVNFGAGSSRTPAVTLPKRLGVACVVAKSFARLFFRNAINTGLSVVICPDAVDATEAGDTIKVDLLKGEVTNVTRGGTYRSTKLPPETVAMLNAGGLVPYLEQRMATRARS